MSHLIRSRAVAIAVGYSLDRLLGEPPEQLHPMVYTGRALTRLEGYAYGDSRTRGVLYLSGVLVIGGLGSSAALRLVGKFGFLASSVSLASASNMLTDEAMAVHDLLAAGEIELARLRLRSLVGRDASELDEAAVARAVIESLAENTVDAVISSLFWGGVFGGAGVVTHRLSNTLDAMIGHRTPMYERFGWAAAKLDDYLNWIPSRLGALAIMATRPGATPAIVRAIANDSQQHPSPNGGVVEAAFAGALGVTLGGTNNYGGQSEDRGTLGEGPPPSLHDISRSVSLSRSISALVAFTPVVAVGAHWVVSRLAGRQVR